MCATGNPRMKKGKGSDPGMPANPGLHSPAFHPRPSARSAVLSNTIARTVAKVPGGSESASGAPHRGVNPLPRERQIGGDPLPQKMADVGGRGFMPRWGSRSIISTTDRGVNPLPRPFGRELNDDFGGPLGSEGAWILLLPSGLGYPGRIFVARDRGVGRALPDPAGTAGA